MDGNGEVAGLKSRWMTITDIAEKIGVTPKTIMRWEKSGKVTRAKRDWRGWRVYESDDLKALKLFKDTIVY
ncbi:MAG: MerR family transcriptional regulator [Deltaproteobacteria bacterium]